ncbi:hypothetical protein AAFF_G00359630 [Aldrovandia affinis]|uniref:Uncharacterized protein n=1 Tax=Aldrovandia affinis TaxID=143900 RepID=A0AAD7WN55_9TELE|nr:hypothetical protein AAFF_G00359630 [Aldrovandia affinis]
MIVSVPNERAWCGSQFGGQRDDTSPALQMSQSDSWNAGLETSAAFFSDGFRAPGPGATDSSKRFPSLTPFLVQPSLLCTRTSWEPFWLRNVNKLLRFGRDQ